MYNIYSNYSSIISLRKSIFTNNQICPSFCNCSYCSPFPLNSAGLISINPSLLYGLSQSSLIPSSKIVLGSNHPFCYRSRTVYDVVCCCCCCCCCGEVCQKGCRVKDCESNRGDMITGRCNVFGDGIRGGISRRERDFRCSALDVGVKKSKGGITRHDRDFRFDVLGDVGVGVKEKRKDDGVDGVRSRITRHRRDFRCNALGVGVGVGVKESKGNVVDRINGRIIRGESDVLRGRRIRSERDFGCNALDEAEAMLSLLSEEGVLVKERNKRSFKNLRNTERDVVSDKCKDVKSNSKGLSGLGCLQSRSKTGEVESVRVHSTKEGRKTREERLSVKIEEEKRLRRRESSSSYYSVLDSGAFGSESEIDVNEDGESSTSQGSDSKTTVGVGLTDVTKDDIKSYKKEKDQQLLLGRQNDVRVGSSTEWDWRKKSEKKLNEESAEVSKSTKESIMRQTKLSRVNGSDSTMGSSSKKQFSNQEEESIADVILRRPLRSSIQTDESVSEYSKSHFRAGNQVSEMLISGNQFEPSTSHVSSHGKLKSQTAIENQESTYLKSKQQYEKSSQENRQNVVMISSTMKRPIQGQEAGCASCKTCGRSNLESNIEYDIPQDSEQPGIHGDVNRTTSGQSHSESSMQAIVETKSKKPVELHFTAGKLDTRRVSGQYSKTLESDYIFDQSASSSQLRTGMQMSNLEVNTASSNSSQHGKKLQEGSSGILIKETESRKLLQTGMKTSHLGSPSLETTRHSASGKITMKEQTHSESKLKEVTEKKGVNKLFGETFVHTSFRTEQQGSALQVGHTENISSEANASEPDASSISQTRVQQVGEVEAKNDLQLVVMSPSYQLEQRSSLDSIASSSFVRGSAGKTSEFNTKNDLQLVVMSPWYQLEQRSSSDSISSSSFVRGSTGKTTEVNTGSGYPQSEARTPLSSDEADEGGTGSLTESSPDVMMKSAQRMQESSSLILSEFVDKMRNESSTSRPSAEIDFSQLDNINVLTGSTLSQAEKGGFTKEDSTRLSGASVTSVVEASKLESSESTLSRRAGKSLWNIVSGVFRWGSSDSRKSPVKAILKSSSNDSAASETWFSGNEHDEGAGVLQEPSSSKHSPVVRSTTRTPQHRYKKEPKSTVEGPTSERPISRRKVTKSQTKKEKQSQSQESTLDKSLIRRSTGISQKGDFRFSRLDDRLSSGEVDVSSFPTASQSGTVSGRMSIGEDTDLNIVQQTSVFSPLASSVSYDGQLKRSDASEEIEEAEKIKEHVSSTRDELISSPSGSMSHSVNVTETDIPTPEETVAELKRRTLQRSKQVVSDRFDEWEDAFRRENEQRKVDEIFMREALAEAIKAADSWEVPVGAVLVQNGTIIARGCNLVEELRDSTAHAEMICIREASNTLRSWRLSDTTLYVTLEPCPMCAGAILQARIKTLVWGAPNKLLGADGSWIRLFPEGAEGGERSEVAEKPAAPPHPFHPNMNIRRGVLEPECAQIMQQFFQLRRKKEKAKRKKSEDEEQPSCLPFPPNATKLLHKMHGVFHI